MKQTDIIKNIENLFRTAVPSPGIFDQNVQASCVIEETMEFVSHLGYDNKTPLYSLKNQLRSGATRIQITDAAATLDDLCDVIITCIGMAYVLGYDLQGALAEVNRSNWSKFENGKALRDGNGKIMKGKDYSPPNLAQFIKFQGK